VESAWVIDDDIAVARTISTGESSGREPDPPLSGRENSWTKRQVNRFASGVYVRLSIVGSFHARTVVIDFLLRNDRVIGLIAALIGIMGAAIVSLRWGGYLLKKLAEWLGKKQPPKTSDTSDKNESEPIGTRLEPKEPSIPWV
jgi:hypothetical protein